MKAEVLKWQNLADPAVQSPPMAPQADETTGVGELQEQGMGVGSSAASLNTERLNYESKKQALVPSIDAEPIPLLDEDTKGASTGLDANVKHSLQERKTEHTTA